MIDITATKQYLKDWVANNTDICPAPEVVDSYFSGYTHEESVTRQRSDLENQFASLSTGENSRLRGIVADTGTSLSEQITFNFCVVKACPSSDYQAQEDAKNWAHTQVMNLLKKMRMDASGFSRCSYPVDKIDLTNVQQFEVVMLGTGEHYGWGISFNVKSTFY